MRKAITSIALLAFLGGCQAIFGKRAELEITPIGIAQSPAVGLVALEEGKQLLRAGQVGSAIAPLQIAAADPATLAEAHNALGVAYAALGRGDMAERFFQQAAAEAPEDARFAANLARYYRSREAALARAAAPAITPATELAVVQDPEFERVVQAGPGVVRVSMGNPARAMSRVSAREVAITTAAPAPAGAIAVGRRNPHFTAVAASSPGQRYPIRIELSTVGQHR